MRNLLLGGGHVFLLILLFVLYMLCQMLIPMSDLKSLASQQQLGAFIIAFVALILLLAWLYRRGLRQNNPRQYQRRQLNWRWLLFAVLMFIGIQLIQTGFNWLLSEKIVSLPVNEQNLDHLAKISPIPSLLLTIIFGPIVEEYLFRGLFFTYFMRSNHAWTGFLGIFLSGLLFGVMHEYQHWPVTLMYASIGWVLGATYYFSKDMRYNICLHILNNILATI